MVLSLSLEPVKSSLHTLTCKEQYNFKVLSKLVNSSLLQTDPFNGHENEKEQLKKYMNIGNHITYKRTCKFGRTYCKGGLGLQSLRREIRHTIARDYYYDIDIVNAHPEILSQILKQNHIADCSYLDKYVRKRDQCLSAIMKKYDIDRHTAKNLFIIIMYGGSYEKWLDDNKLDKNGKLEFIVHFQNEMRQINKVIAEANKKIEEEISKNKERNNIASSVTSYYLQEIENRILEEAFQHCKEHGYINDDNDCVLCFDGLMLLKNTFDEELLEELHALVKTKFNLDLKFINKEMDEGYTEQDIDNNQLSTYSSDDVFKLVSQINNNDVAKFYYKFIEKDKYKRSPTRNWYELDDHNVYKQMPDCQPPSSLLNDISDKVMAVIQEEMDKLKPPVIGSENFDKQNKDYCDKRKMFNSAYKSVGSSNFSKGCIDYLGNLYTDKHLEDKLDGDNNLIAFNNGYLYDIVKNEYREIMASDYISRTMNIKHNDKINDAKVEEVHKLLLSIFEDEEIINHWLKIHGISLFTNKREKLYILTGKGGNGKSLLMDLLHDCIGDYFYQSQSNFFTSKKQSNGVNSTLAKCKGVRILSVSEPQSESMNEVSLNGEAVKETTGRDEISTRDLYKSEFSYIPQFSCFLLCNDLPSIKKLDNGIIRRLEIVNYPLNFVDEDKMQHDNDRLINVDLKDQLKADEGLKQAFMHLLFKTACENMNTNIVIPEKCRALVSEYIEDNNPVFLFLSQYCEITNNDKDRVKRSEFHNMFKCLTRSDMTEQSIGKAMMFNNVGVKKNRDGIYCYVGIKRKPEQEEDTTD